jgi:hypothetical protein
MAQETGWFFITGEDLAKGVKIKEILPLVFSVKFLDTGSSSSSTRFAMQIVRVNAPDARGTPPTSMSTVMMSVGEENDLFKLLEVRPADAPKEVLLEMKKDAQVVTLAKGQVFERVDGYIANLPMMLKTATLTMEVTEHHYLLAKPIKW